MSGSGILSHPLKSGPTSVCLIMMPEEDHTATYEGENQHRTDRRTVLASATAVATALAGCAGGGGEESTETEGASTDSSSEGDGGSEEATTEEGSSVIDEVGFDGTDLQVTLSNTDGVTQINLIENNEVISSSEVSAGGSTVTIRSFDSTVREREFEFAAVDQDGAVVDSVTKSFSAKPTVSRIRSAAVKEGLADASEEEIKDNANPFTQPLVTVENSGNAPFFIGTRSEEVASVFLQTGIPEPNGTVYDPTMASLISSGETQEFQPHGRAYLGFRLSFGEPSDDWPENIRNMGEWPDGYADGDTVTVTLTMMDGSEREYESRIDLTYSGGLVQVTDDIFVARSVTSE